MSFELIDEYADPSLRVRLATLLASSRTADIAIAELRLAGLDLAQGEVGGLERCRIMLGRLDADSLHDSATRDSRLLMGFALSGRLQVRRAPHHNWNPDFSIFHDHAKDAAVLVGAHYFGRPYPLFGLALTAIFRRSDVIATCEHRFEQLWAAGYDVLPVIIDTLERLGG